MATLFPEEMKTSAEMSMETVASKLSYFYEQVHLLHWQTNSFAEHSALGSLYDKLVDFKDEIVEKLMGYSGGRRIKAFKITPLVDYSSGLSTRVVKQIMEFASQLEEWAEENEYCDIENIAQSLSGEASKTNYLLTLT